MNTIVRTHEFALPNLSFHFHPGTRPQVNAIVELAEGDPRFAVTLAPPAGDWLELHLDGFLFDLRGLAPGDPERVTAHRVRFGLSPNVSVSSLEALTLSAAPHLLGGETMEPVLRGQIALGACIAGLSGLRAVGWSMAASLTEPGRFRSEAGQWLAGGALPEFLGPMLSAFELS